MLRMSWRATAIHICETETTADRLLVRRDSHGRPVYYRTISRNAGYSGANHGAYGNYSGASRADRSYGYNSLPYGNANGYYRNGSIAVIAAILGAISGNVIATIAMVTANVITSEL